MSNYTEHFCQMADGINIYYRSYGDPQSPLTPVICIPGLNRSTLGFHKLATALSAKRRVICVDLRGRGKSDYDEDYTNYKPGRYVRDIQAVLEDAGLDAVIAIGTSLGGIVTMVGAAMKPGMWAGGVLNDVGPVVDKAGTDRIAGYVGQMPPPKTWDDAITTAKYQSEAAYPDFTEEDWDHFARCMYATDENGLPVDNYDPNIRKTFGGDAGDMWELYEKLNDTPVLVLHGEISDILSAETAREMSERHPDAEIVTIKRVGHAPTLTEDASLKAIESFLGRIDHDRGAS